VIALLLRYRRFTCNQCLIELQRKIVHISENVSQLLEMKKVVVSLIARCFSPGATHVSSLFFLHKIHAFIVHSTAHAATLET
jgi:hypothetical protein